MRVRHIMRTTVRTIAPTETTSFARELCRRYEIHHLVVTEGKKNVLGVIADRDLVNVDENTPVRDVMTHPPITIGPDETARKAAALMTGHGVGSLPVVEDGKLTGIVTTSDLLAMIAKGALHPGSTKDERPVLAKRGPRKRPVGLR